MHLTLYMEIGKPWKLRGQNIYLKCGTILVYYSKSRGLEALYLI